MRNNKSVHSSGYHKEYEIKSRTLVRIINLFLVLFMMLIVYIMFRFALKVENGIPLVLFLIYFSYYNLKALYLSLKEIYVEDILFRFFAKKDYVYILNMDKAKNTSGVAKDFCELTLVELENGVLNVAVSKLPFKYNESFLYKFVEIKRFKDDIRIIGKVSDISNVPSLLIDYVDYNVDIDSVETNSNTVNKETVIIKGVEYVKK